MDFYGDARPWAWADAERAAEIRRDEQWDAMGWTEEEGEEEDDD